MSLLAQLGYTVSRIYNLTLKLGTTDGQYVFSCHEPNLNQAQCPTQDNTAV